MSQMFTLDCPSDEAVRWITEALANADLQAVTSFDLTTARATQSECSCPQHGTAACDCQMVVLLVYGTEAVPVTVVLHGRDGHVSLSLADTPGKRPPRELTSAVLAALRPESFPHLTKAS